MGKNLGCDSCHVVVVRYGFCVVFFNFIEHVHPSESLPLSWLFGQCRAIMEKNIEWLASIMSSTVNCDFSSSAYACAFEMTWPFCISIELPLPDHYVRKNLADSIKWTVGVCTLIQKINTILLLSFLFKIIQVLLKIVILIDCVTEFANVMFFFARKKSSKYFLFWCCFFCWRNVNIIGICWYPLTMLEFCWFEIFCTFIFNVLPLSPCGYHH